MQWRHVLGLVGLVALSGCAGEAASSDGAGAEGEEENEVVGAKTLYVADLGPFGLELYTRKGTKTAKLSKPGELTGDEDGPNSGTVRIGGDGCDGCLFFQHPRTDKWINVGRPNGRSLSLTKRSFSYKAIGFTLTNSIVRVTVAPDDPEYGQIAVAWP